MAKKKLSERAQDEATLRRERAIGGPLSRAVDRIMTEREELRDVAGDLLDYCINNVAYFGEDEATAKMLDRAEDVLGRSDP
jgi:hypothetical protein